MRKHIQDGLQIALAILITGGTAHAMTPTEVADVQKTPVAAVEKKIEDKKIAPVEQPIAPQALPEPVPAPPAPVPVVLDNETRVWNFLTAQGFSRAQTAGIMGNLQQEHNFQTSNAAGGLGIAQWIGGRKAALMSFGGCVDTPNGVVVGGCLELEAQLNFLMSELNGAESTAGAAIRASTSVEEATVAFQNKFERCGDCRESQRIGYSYGILGRH